MNLIEHINLIVQNGKRLMMSNCFDVLKLFLVNNIESFAIFGADLALKGDYQKAIEYLSVAIGLDFNDSRCYFNRAYCYLEVNELDKALKDIHMCISLDPTWAKGSHDFEPLPLEHMIVIMIFFCFVKIAFFKMGQILARKKLYKQAEISYKRTLEIEPNCKETFTQISGNIYDALLDEGFDEIKAGYASEKFFSIEDARKGLLCGIFEINLQRTRFLKKKKFKKLISKKGILIPINFY